MQVAIGMLVSGVEKIILCMVIRLNLLWILTKTVAVLHVCNCLISMAKSSSIYPDSFCWLPLKVWAFYRFDPGGPGSCLRRYSDPTFFKRASAGYGEACSKKIRKDKKVRRTEVLHLKPMQKLKLTAKLVTRARDLYVLDNS